MMLLKGIKLTMFGFAMFPLGMGALGTGILFAAYNIAVSRNPEEAESLYNTTLAGFAFIESFIFIAMFVSIMVNLLL